MTRHTRVRSLAAHTMAWAAVVTLAVVGCAPLPAAGPSLATDGGPGERPPSGQQVDPGTPPEWLAPRTDLDWAPCASGPTSGMSEGDRIDCARIGETPVLRLTTSDTPDDAPPLVVVAGPEHAPDVLATRLAGSGTEITSARPVVVLDHRGRTGPAGSCLTFEGHRTLDGLADEGVDPTDPAVRRDLADASQSCTDLFLGEELSFSSTAAAADLEALRQRWGVPGLAVLGLGTGARTALAYAGAHPGALSMLVLDSPAPFDGDQETAARSALSGSDTALRLWAASCTHDECGPGAPDQKVTAVTAALEAARGPDADVPAALLSDVIRDALGDISGASSPDPSPGDILLGDLVAADPGRIPESVRDRARRLSSSSLPYVVGCSDMAHRVPISRIPELSDEWSQDPPFGEILAAQLAACSTWPIPQPTPVTLPGPAPVILLSGIADPVAGAAPMEPVAGALSAAGAAEVTTVTWGAPGSDVVLHSACGRSAVASFLADPSAMDPSTACPS